MYACEHCGRGVQVGRHIRHHRGVAGGRWKRKAPVTGRLWLPNLHMARVVEGGKILRRRLCTLCLRRAERPHQALDGNSKPVDSSVSKVGSSGGQAKPKPALETHAVQTI